MRVEDRNVALLKEAYRRWHESKAASTDHWMEILADEVEFRSLSEGAPGMEFTDRCHTKDEVLGYFAGLVATWEMLHYTVEEFIAQGERVVMLGRCGWRHRETGQVIETPKADFWRFRDGKAIEFYEFYDTAKTASATGH